MIPRGPSGPVWSGTQRPDSKTGYPFASPSRRRSSFRIFPFLFPPSSFSIDDYRFPLSLSLARPLVRSFSSTCFKEASLEGSRGRICIYRRETLGKTPGVVLAVGKTGLRSTDRSMNAEPFAGTFGRVKCPVGYYLASPKQRSGRDRRR